LKQQDLIGFAVACITRSGGHAFETVLDIKRQLPEIDDENLAGVTHHFHPTESQRKQAMK